MSTTPKPGNPYYLPPRRARRRTDPFAGWTTPLPGIQLGRRARLRRSSVFLLLTALRLLGILSLFGGLIAAGVVLGLFAFDGAQAHVVAPTPTATPAPTRTPIPTPTPNPPTPSPTLRPPAIGVGYGLAYIWESKKALSAVEGPVVSGAEGPVLSGAEEQVDTLDNVFSCMTCGDGKPDKREYFVCATGYEATLKGRELGVLERAPGRDNPGVCIVGVWGATFKRMAIGISSDMAMALGVTPGKVPEIEIYTNNIPEGYLLGRPAGREAGQNDNSWGTRPRQSPQMAK
ncbi:MAG TPA: hypothetical protein VJ793_03965 [Anaerolineae bacterium]|nr:hypothetical protein [Anaerolineae bacterium]